MQRDMSMIKQQYEQDLQNATLTGISSGQDFLYTSLAPADFTESLGWSTFTFNVGDYTSYANSSFDSSGWKANAAGSFLGLFAGDGSAAGSSSRTESTNGFNSSQLTIRFSICQVPIVMPWFKDAYLLSNCWQFDPTNPDFKSRLISDGGSPPQGYIPAYSTAIVFITDLFLSLDQNSSMASWMQQPQSASQNGSGVLSLGFLNLGGSASHSSNSGYSQRTTNVQWNDQGLSVPGMQIAGFKCHVITTKCPVPDPSIKNWV